MALSVDVESLLVELVSSLSLQTPIEFSPIALIHTYSCHLSHTASRSKLRAEITADGDVKDQRLAFLRK